MTSDRGKHGPVERLLHGVIFAKPVRQPEARGGDEVAHETARSDRQEVAAEVAAQDAPGSMNER